MSDFGAMTRDVVIKKYLKMLKDLHLKVEDVWLGAGSAAIMHGLRETTRDLDAGCGAKVFYLVADRTDSEIQIFSKADGYLQDNTQLYALPDYAMDMHLEADRVPAEMCIIDGVQCYTLETLLAQKTTLAKILNRKKDWEDIAKIKQKILESSAKKTAVIIQGNSDIIASKEWSKIANEFYGDIKLFLESRGFTVTYDPGLEYTKPTTADLWVGHSRGVSRLKFAPPETVTLSLGDDLPGSINHPKDTDLRKGGVLTKFHFTLTGEMEKKIDTFLQKNGLLKTTK